MALVTEDGTGQSTAESYISVSAADTYFAARADAVWTALTTAAKEASLRKATEYLDAVYGLRWAGIRVNSTQALDWPRYYVERRDVSGENYRGVLFYDSDAVPTIVARACAELAVRASAGDLLADVGGQVLSEQVGPIAVTYAPGARQGTKYGAIEAMLAPFLRNANGVAVVRA